MKTYRIVLTYTGPDDDIHTGHPSEWDWYILLNIGNDEAVTLDEITEVGMPSHHITEIHGNHDL